MPKVQLTEKMEMDEAFRKALIYAKACMGCETKSELAERLGFARQNLYQKINSPETLTLKQLRRIIVKGQLTDEQILSIVRTKRKEAMDKPLTARDIARILKELSGQQNEAHV